MTIYYNSAVPKDMIEYIDQNQRQWYAQFPQITIVHAQADYDKTTCGCVPHIYIGVDCEPKECRQQILDVVGTKFPVHVEYNEGWVDC